VYWDESRARSINGRCHVISEGGLGAKLADQLRVGEMILMQLSSGLRLYAVVRNVSGFNHGMEFVLVRQPQRVQLNALVQHCAEAERDERLGGMLTP
jgi:PilZ domain